MILSSVGPERGSCEEQKPGRHYLIGGAGKVKTQTRYALPTAIRQKHLEIRLFCCKSAGAYLAARRRISRRREPPDA